MPRLPQPGGDSGNWGQILNDYLAQSHSGDGTIKPNSVGTSQLIDSSVTKAKLSASGGTNGQVLTTDGTSLSWATVSGSGAVPDATTSAKGLVQLAGDLAGTAAAPTVPGLAGKANDSTVVHLAGNETVTGVKNFTGTLQAGGAAVVITSDARLSDQRTPANASVVPTKLDSVAAPTNGQILSYNGTKFNWVAAPTGGSDPVMGGDISGTASNAQLIAGAVGTAELASGAVSTVKIADDAITEPKLAATNAPSSSQVLSWNGSALTWVTPASGGGGGSFPTYTYRTITADATAAAGDFILADSTSAAITITLPAPVANRTVVIKRLNGAGNGIQVAAPSGSYIDASGLGTATANSTYSTLTVVSDGTNWYRI